MKKPERIFIALMLGLAVLVAPVVAASGIPFGNSLITTDTEYSGNGVMNETNELKWTTGTDTYEWKQISANVLGLKTQSVMNIRQDEGSMHWAFQRTGYTIPFQGPINQYVDDHTIMKPLYRLSYYGHPV